MVLCIFNKSIRYLIRNLYLKLYLLMFVAHVDNFLVPLIVFIGLFRYSIPKLIMEWVPLERRKRGRPRKTWIERVQAAMTTRNLETDQWRNREEWRLVSGRRRQLL